jgi:Mg2+ and Co2+ transporter CorA
MNLLQEIDEQLDKKISFFEKQYKPYIEELRKQVKDIEKDLEKEKENYRKLSQDINE